MKTKTLAINALFLGIGTILHYITPPLFFGVKPDFLLAIMFLGFMMNDDKSSFVLLSVGAGIISAITTAFPGGQIPSLIDKMVSATLMYVIFKTILLSKKNMFTVAFINFLGTIISGIVFITCAMYMAGFNESIYKVIVFVIFPTAIINTIFSTVIYKALEKVHFI